MKSNLKQTINKYKESEGVSQRSAFRDSITDIMHLCKESGMDFDKIVEDAKEVYQEENF